MRFTFTLFCLFSFFASYSQNSFVETFGTGTSADVSTYTGYTGGIAATNYTSTGGVSITTGSTIADGGSQVTILQNSTFTISNIPTALLTNVAILFYFNRSNGQGTRTFQVNTGAGWVTDANVNLNATGQNNVWLPHTSATYPVNGTISFRIVQTNGNSATVNNLDFITIGNPLTLPLLNRNFTAAAVGNQVKLNWTGTATHLNSHFEVERSNNGRDKFQQLSTIMVSSIGEEKYEFIDKTPLKPEAYYRIKMVDENNRITYTKTLKVISGGTHFALDNLFPTAATSQLNLLISSSKSQQTRVEIVDQSGRITMAQNLTVNSGSQSYQLNVTSLSKGFYILRLRNGDEVVSSRFIKQ